MDIGGFDEKFPTPCWGEDTDLGNRVMAKNKNIYRLKLVNNETVGKVTKTWHFE